MVPLFYEFLASGSHTVVLNLHSFPLHVPGTSALFAGVFSRLAFRALPTIPKPSPAWQWQLRGPALPRGGSCGRSPPAGWPQHAPAGPQVHWQLCRLLLSLAPLQRAQLWDQPLSSLTRLLGLRGDEGGGGGEEGWKEKGRESIEERRGEDGFPPSPSSWVVPE